MKKLTSVFLAFLFTSGIIFAQSMAPLTVGEKINESLVTDEKDSFSLTLEANQFVFGYAYQKTVDVVVTILGPDGEQLGAFDSPARGRESFQFETETAGTYTFEVTPFEEEEGDYYMLVSVAEPVAEDPAEKVNQFMTQYTGPEVPGAAALVIKDGEVIFKKSYGMANLAHDIPIQEKTRHNIGSTSKQFLTFGLLLLQEEGKLNLEDDVREYIPELPEFDQVVTLRNLVNHTSGYREFLNLLSMSGRNPSSTLSQEMVIEIVQRQPELQNLPDAEFNYNNTGYVLMTEVIERVTDMSFPEWMKENVFEPIGMNNTVVRSNQNQIVENRSQGYTDAENGGFEEVTDLGGAMGAGGIHSTLDDLAKWMKNLLNPKVGNAALIKEMTTAHMLTSGASSEYGLGLFVQEYKGLPYFHHGGADMAHRSMLMVFPEINAGVVTQSNYANFNGGISYQIADAFLEEHMEEETPEEEEGEIEEEESESGEFEYDPADFEALTGRYELEVMPGFILTFSRDDDRIYTQATGQPEIDITATTDSTFSLVGVNASVTFHRNQDGTADSLTLHQNGNHIAKKIDFELSLEEMKEYTGRYFSEEIETVYDIAIKDSSLKLMHYQMEDDITLNAGSEDSFNGGFPMNELTFERDESGAITGFNASNGRTRGVFFKKWSD